MRAAVFDRYGPPEVVGIEEVTDPVPSPKQVLVRVHAAAVNSGDARIRAARFPKGFGFVARVVFGLRRPRRRVLGVAVSGVVAAVGDRVTGFSVGDEVCGMTNGAHGTHAELTTVRAEKLAVKPAGVSHVDAAAVLFGGSTAQHFLAGRVGPGASVLVNGASGAVGTSAVQLAKRAGARVTGVCSADNAELVTGLGADVVVDYRRTPLDSLQERYDVVLDTVGIPTELGRSLLAPGGVLLLVAADLRQTLRARGDVVAGPASEKAAAFATLLDLVSSGELRVVVDRTLPLEQIVEAHRLVDSGRKVGNVVVLP
ncbi:MAG: hypothetical protein AVDCRST_MAG32-2010 [uncultured Nocardioides sp.]|uniref:Enoyl reductase (ER) domain-containing protein n=1 Tax=uncultured Nocardioides sp. TaxID=198441 RepID=A0A6J4NGB1_9ACTN|nr:MAG: hypothetical protein AVDCRST_MAG32-2010 [uncultured Nocardioides sp.]